MGAGQPFDHSGSYKAAMVNTETLPSADNTCFKRQRVEEQPAPTVVQGVPLTQPSLAALQEMQLQSVAALQHMVTALSQSDYQLKLNAAVQVSSKSYRSRRSFISSPLWPP